MAEELNHILTLANKLHNRHVELLSEIQDLREENSALKTRLETLKDRFESIDRNNKLQGVGDSITSSPEERKQLKKMLGHYIREIDKCMELMSS